MADETIGTTRWGDEHGSTGLSSAGRYIRHDFIPSLSGSNGMRAFHEMRENEPLIHGIVFAHTSAVRSVEWNVEAVNRSQKAVKLRDWLYKEMFEEAETPLPDVMTTAAENIVYGCMPHEIVLAPRQDNTIGLRKLSIRAPETISEWIVDDEEEKLTAILQYQTGIRKRKVEAVPIEKLLLFRTEHREDMPAGRSLLRGAYRYYVRKKAIEEAEGRMALRAGGMVHFQIPRDWMSNSASPAEKEIIKKLISAANEMAEDRKGFLFTPSDVNPDTREPYVKVNFLVPDSARPVDVQPMIERMDSRIVVSVLAGFILMGHQDTGSYALGKLNGSMFDRAAQIGLTLNRAELQKKLIQRLWLINAFDPELMPTIEHSPVALDTQILADVLGGLLNVGALRNSPELTQYLAQLFKVPQPSEEELQAIGEGDNATGPDGGTKQKKGGGRKKKPTPDASGNPVVDEE